MKQTVKGILNILKEQFAIEVPLTLEIRITDLYDLGKITSIDDYDKILYALMNGQNQMFSNRQMVEAAFKKAVKAKDKNQKVLILSSNAGSSLYSSAIMFEKLLSESSDKIFTYYSFYPSFLMSEKAANPNFSYNDVMSAEKYELSMMLNKLEYFTVKSEIKEKCAVITGNPMQIPFKDESFNLILINGFSQFYQKEKGYLMGREIHRVLKDSGHCFADSFDRRILSSTFLIEDLSDDVPYFHKNINDIIPNNESPYSIKDVIEFFNCKKYDEAVMILHNLLAKDEEINYEYYKLLLLIYVRQGDIFKIQYLEKVFQMNNLQNSEFDFIIGSYYYNRSDYALAKKYFERALEIRNDFVFAMYYIAIIDKLSGKVDSAKKRFREIIEIIKSHKVFNPELYSEMYSLDMIEYISNNEIDGGGSI